MVVIKYLPIMTMSSAAVSLMSKLLQSGLLYTLLACRNRQLDLDSKIVTSLSTVCRADDPETWGRCLNKSNPGPCSAAQRD